MEKRKYEFNGETMTTDDGKVLHRIVATEDFGEVKAGDVGGWIETYENLCDSAWVFGEAQVSGEARVSGSARVFDSAWVSDSARVFGSAWVFGEAQVFGEAWVFGEARVFDSAWVSGSARVSDSARVSGSARVFDSAWVRGSARVSDSARVSGSADLITFGGFGSCNRTTTVFKCEDGEFRVVCGCFFGTVEEFAKKVEETRGDSLYGREYKAIIEVIKVHFEDFLQEKSAKTIAE